MIKLEVFDENDPWEHMMKVLFGCGIYAAFRGCSEHVLFSPTTITRGVYPNNYECQELAGIHYVEISIFVNDKSHKLSVHQGYSRSTGNSQRFPIDDHCDSNFGAALWRLKEKMAPGQTRMYCYPIVLTGAKREDRHFDDIPIYNLNKPIGENKLRSMFKEGAKKLGLPETFKAHSLRALCITNLVNDGGVSIAETMAVARHSSVSASATYQCTNGFSEKNRMKALGLTIPPQKKQKLDCSSVASSFTQEDDFVEVTRRLSPPPTDDNESVVLLQGRKNISRASCAPPKTEEHEEMYDSGSVVQVEGRKNISRASCAPPKMEEHEEVSMTQVGIDNLMAEIKQVHELMNPPPARVPLVARASPPPISENQLQILELRRTVLGLKKRLENQEHDGLYQDSVESEHVREIERLRSHLNSERDYDNGYTREREGRDGWGRRRY